MVDKNYVFSTSVAVVAMTLLLAFAKAIGVMHWPWILVLAPTLIPIVVFIVVFCIAFVVEVIRIMIRRIKNA